MQNPISPSPRRRSTPLILFLVAIAVVITVAIESDPIAWRQRFMSPSPAVSEISLAVPAELEVSVDPVTVGNLEVDYETAVLMNIYDKGNPSVVQISILGQDRTRPLGEGSGFVWDLEGHIVTNAHVVRVLTQRSGTLLVTFHDDTVSIGEVAGWDLDSDLAVVRIDPEGYDLQPVTLGRMDDLQVGMRVAAIGAPFSQTQTLTSGIISALGRNMMSLVNYQIPDSIQFDAAVNPGNSGGPLFNDRGEVVGVVTQIISPERVSSGIGLAVPVSIVRRVIPALIETGTYAHSYLGIAGCTYSPIFSTDLQLPKDVRGTYIDSVAVPNSPARRGGLRGGSTRISNQGCPRFRGGDLVLGIENQAVKSLGDLMVYLERYTSPGDSVTLTVLRDGQTIDLEIVLGARPTS